MTRLQKQGIAKYAPAWITGTIAVAGLVGNYAVQGDQVDSNTTRINHIEVKQQDDRELLIRIDENVKQLKERIR